MIRATASTGAVSAAHPGGSLLLRRKSRRPLQLSVLSFQSSSRFLGASPCALILIRDSEARSASRAALLSNLYQLTPAECRLADLLLQDLNLAESAESLHITPGTAGFMLKSILRKTHTNRQAELIRFLLGLPKISPQ